MQTTAAVDWTAAQSAVARAATRAGALVRSIRRPEAPALGGWTVLDVAVHLSHAMDGVKAMAQGGGGVLEDIWRLGDLTGALVRGEAERDKDALAARIESSATDFLGLMRDAEADGLRTWFVPGVEVPLSTLTCHVLNELVIHGHDIAKAEGLPWPIERTDGNLIVNGFLFPVIAGIGQSMVDPQAAAGVRVTYDMRVKGGGRAQLRFDDGTFSLRQGPPTGRVDCHLLVDPVAFMLVAWGRMSQWQAIARGQMLAWGRRPWTGPKLRQLLRNP